jgi:hypothetical protein
MKKALLTVVVILAALSVQAQNVRIGLSGGVNSTWLLNKNVLDADDDLDIAAPFGGRFGIDAIYSFNEKVGISLGVNFISVHNQKYTGETDDKTYSFDSKLKLNYLDIPILFRLTSSGGSYFEIGPQFSFLGKAEEELESNIALANYSGKDVKSSLNSTNIGLILGFGVDIDVTENIYITTGLRLGYGFSDVTKEFNEAELPDPGPFGTNSLANYWAHFEDANTTGDGNADNDFSYEKTSRVFGGLHIGVSYKFGGE